MQPTWAPPSDGATPPASPPSPAPEAPNPEAKPEEKPETSDSTPPEPSPSGDPAPKPEPTSEEAAAAARETARAVVHTEASAYAVNLADEAREALGLGDAEDPLVKGITEHFAKSGLSQGALDDFLSTAGDLAKAGLFGTGFDPAAETAKLGANAAGRRREIEIFADALKGRGDLTDGEFGALMSLSPEADGVTLIEKLRVMMGDKGVIDPPATSDPAGGDPIERAKAMRRDPRYETDKAFRKEADAAFQAAHRSK